MDDFSTLTDAIQNARSCVAFTGAGVSTLSGIRDFRGKSGLYTEVDANKIFSLDFFHEDPSFYYTHTKELIYDVDDKRPSIVHRQLAHLEKTGRLRAVITQNIDTLHHKAGSRYVLELHGSPLCHRCLACGKQFEFAEIRTRLLNDDIPYCTDCSGTIKPDITFFGEMLDQDILAQAFDEAARADLMLVLGSSLVVQPAASMPVQTLNHGGDIIIINDMETPLDSYATLRYSDLKTSFEAIAKAFGSA